MSVERPFTPELLRIRALNTLSVIYRTGLLEASPVIEGINTGAIHVHELLDHKPWAANFDIDPADSTPKGMPRGMLWLDTSPNINPLVARAEMARTALVAHTYPDNGYEARLRDIYASAIDRQAEWLRANNISSTLLDRRDKFPSEAKALDFITEQLLGTTMFYKDFGFGDWNAAVEEMSILVAEEAQGNWKKDLIRLAELEGNLAEFLRGRNSQNDGLGRICLPNSAIDPKVVAMDADARAGVAVRAVIKKLLMAPKAK